MNTQQIWAFIGQLAMAAGGLWATIQIFRFFSSSNEKLIATIEPGSFEIPPVVFEEISKHDPKDYVLYGHLRELHTQISINVENRSKKPCENISILIPRCSYAVLNHENGETQNLKINSEITIPNLKAKTRVTVRAWSTSYSLFEKEIKISHRDGTAKIKTFRKVPKIVHTLITIIGLLGLMLIPASLLGILLGTLVENKNYSQPEKTATVSDSSISTNMVKAEVAPVSN